MNALVVRVILSLIIFFSLLLSSNLSVADDKPIPLKKLFKVAKIDLDKKIAGHSSNLLSDGKLLIIGGKDDTGPLSSILGLRVRVWVNFAPFPLFGKEGSGEIL